MMKNLKEIVKKANVDKVITEQFTEELIYHDDSMDIFIDSLAEGYNVDYSDALLFNEEVGSTEYLSESGMDLLLTSEDDIEASVDDYNDDVIGGYQPMGMVGAGVHDTQYGNEDDGYDGEDDGVNTDDVFDFDGMDMDANDPDRIPDEELVGEAGNMGKIRGSKGKKMSKLTEYDDKYDEEMDESYLGEVDDDGYPLDEIFVTYSKNVGGDNVEDNWAHQGISKQGSTTSSASKVKSNMTSNIANDGVMGGTGGKKGKKGKSIDEATDLNYDNGVGDVLSKYSGQTPKKGTKFPGTDEFFAKTQGKSGEHFGDDLDYEEGVLDLYSTSKGQGPKKGTKFPGTDEHFATVGKKSGAKFGDDLNYDGMVGNVLSKYSGQTPKKGSKFPGTDENFLTKIREGYEDDQDYDVNLLDEEDEMFYEADDAQQTQAKKDQAKARIEKERRLNNLRAAKYNAANPDKEQIRLNASASLYEEDQEDRDALLDDDEDEASGLTKKEKCKTKVAESYFVTESKKSKKAKKDEDMDMEDEEDDKSKLADTDDDGEPIMDDEEKPSKGKKDKKSKSSKSDDEDMEMDDSGDEDDKAKLADTDDDGEPIMDDEEKPSKGKKDKKSKKSKSSKSDDEDMEMDDSEEL